MKLKIFSTIVFSTCLFFSAFSQISKEDEVKINRVLKIVESDYVDSVDGKVLVSEAIKAMMEQLDPHSKYLSIEENKRSQEAITGNFAGVGIQYQIIRDTLNVLKVTLNGPAAQAGISVGDKLIAIDNEVVAGKGNYNSYYSGKLRGQLGSIVTIDVIKRNGETKKYEIKRATISNTSIEAAYMVDSENAYIKVSSFSYTTYADFRMACIQLQLKGMKNLIIDLRNNPGGVMKSSIDLASLFLKDTNLIVYTQGLHYPRENYRATNQGDYSTGRLVVMVDENSASASEIFAGAIQDLDRGIIVGRRTYGKGLVGRNFTLPDGSAIRITTGRYYTPSGRSIQKAYIKGEKSSYDLDLERRIKHGELVNKDSINFPDSLLYKTRNGRTVYGGGGIMPDIFLALDTNTNYQLLKACISNGSINLFAGLYFEKNLENLKILYPYFSAFHSNFIFDNALKSDFENYLKQEYKLQFTNEEWEFNKDKIISYFKGILARNLYEASNYFEEINNQDQEFVQAVRIINEKKYFKALGIQEN